MNNYYTISDFDGYANAVREGAAKSLSENYGNLDDYITINEVKSIVTEISETDENGNFIVTDDSYNDTFDMISKWIYGIGLAKLAAQGLVECAWDSEENAMIFWAASNECN